MFPISDSDLQTRSRPYVNVTIIILCALAFVYELVIGDLEQSILFFKFGVIPNELVHGISYMEWQTPLGDFNIETPVSNWTTMFTSMFLHGDWLHFGVNMLFLWVFGDNVEDRFGHFRYLLFYLAAGVAATWLQIAVDTTSTVPTIGASGAIAGVLGAYLLLFPFSRVRTAVIFFFIIFVRIPAIILLGFWFLLQFFSGIGTLGLASQGGGVAYWAHIGGFLFGIIVVIIYKLAIGQGIWPGGPGRGPTGDPETPVYWRGRRL
ncbi:MAG: rhomboid family intramembrane serine protease [Dehalococcoidia bacterium]|nr:MAG: rhomboid family intramembrane serine protease [Dehalococcoidia bacterium]UCG83853.1 MAG: rhomboid family intramembrane serine protease [Dehalococcoidia bacterium]